MSSISVGCEKLSEAYRRFCRACAALPPARRDQAGVCGIWSPRQVVAHLAGWDQEAARRFQVLREQPDHSVTYHVDAANARWVAERDDLDWDAVRADLDRAQALLQQAAATVSEEMFQATPAFGEWLAGRTVDYHTHAAQFEEWIRA